MQCLVEENKKKGMKQVTVLPQLENANFGSHKLRQVKFVSMNKHYKIYIGGKEKNIEFCNFFTINLSFTFRHWCLRKYVCPYFLHYYFWRRLDIRWHGGGERKPQPPRFHGDSSYDAITNYSHRRNRPKKHHCWTGK